MALINHMLEQQYNKEMNLEKIKYTARNLSTETKSGTLSAVIIIIMALLIWLK